ncbi:MAG: hypothetical protein RH917_05485 [Lacipirellulaceae bacterium]
MFSRSFISLLAFSLATIASRPTSADIYFTEEKTEEGHKWTYRLTVTPAAASTPLLKYRLLQPEVEKKSGNCVPFILKALNESQQAWRDHKPLLFRRPDGRDASDLFEGLANRDLGKPALREIVETLPFDRMLAQLQEASLRSECDWQFELHDMTGVEIINFTLEDHQESRQLTRFITLLACHQIATRDYDTALETIKLHTEFALSMSKPELLVCRLIGIAELNMMNEQIVRLMASPLSPNLYWPLTELPQPPVPMRDAIRFDLSLGLRSFPVLQAPEAQQYDAARWRLEFQKFREDLGKFQELLGNNDEPLRVALQKLIDTDQMADVYPAAKRRLETKNVPAWDLSVMPPEQAILVDASQEYHRVLDDVTTWSTLPFPELVKHADWNKGKTDNRPSNLDSYGALLAQVALPALKAVRKAEARLVRDIAAMRLIEALRMHAAETGQFPEILEKVKCVPVPENPSTGEPFVYRLEGKDAILDLPFSDGHTVAKTYRLQLMGGGK